MFTGCAQSGSIVDFFSFPDILFLYFVLFLIRVVVKA